MPAQAVLRSGRKVLLTLDPNPDVLGIADWYTEQAQKGALFAPSLSGLVRLEDVEQIRVVRAAWWRHLRASAQTFWEHLVSAYRDAKKYNASLLPSDSAWLVLEPEQGHGEAFLTDKLPEVDNGA